jgi:hypothetical protein
MEGLPMPPPGEAAGHESSRAGGGTIVNLSLDERLESIAFRDRGLSSREGIDLVVATWLQAVIHALITHGFEGGSIGRRKPRRISVRSWDSLQAASERTGLPASTILRACMRLEAGRMAPKDDPNQKEGDVPKQQEGEAR